MSHPATALTMRRATPADREAVVALIFDTLRSFGIEPEPLRLDAETMRFGDTGDTSVFDYVAEIDGVLVGSVSLRDRGDDTGRISKFFVDERARGRGVGRSLLALAVTQARARSLKILDLETREAFEAAVHIYESTGWKRGPDPENACDRAYTLTL